MFLKLLLELWSREVIGTHCSFLMIDGGVLAQDLGESMEGHSPVKEVPDLE